MTHDATITAPNNVGPAGTITTVAQDEWRASLELSGEFDARNAAELRAALDAHLEAGRRVLRIDTRSVTFIDSSAVGAIVNVHARCQHEHGSLILTGVHSRTARLFEITGLDRVLLIDTAGDDSSDPAGASGESGDGPADLGSLSTTG